MLGYVTLGTNDLEASVQFYDALLAVCGAQQLMNLEEGFVLWGTSLDDAALAVAKPYNQEPATVGNGVMAAIRVDSKEMVDALYAKAIALGGTDEGPPGDRGDGFYAGYFRDNQGNKLNAFYIG